MIILLPPILKYVLIIIKNKKIDIIKRKDGI